MFNYRNLNFVCQPILKVVKRKTREPQRILLILFGLASVLEYSRIANLIQPIQHPNIHDRRTLKIEYRFSEIAYPQLLEQIVEKAIFLDKLDSIHPSFSWKIEHPLMLPMRKHLEERLGKA